METRQTYNQMNALHQQNYRQRLKDKDLEGYKAKMREQMKIYRANRKAMDEVQRPTKVIQKPAPVDIQQIIEKEPSPSSRRQKRYKKNQNISSETTPSHQIRKDPLEKSTINDYINKLNIINKILKSESLENRVKVEIDKLLNGNPSITNYIIMKMPYLKTIDTTIQLLRQKYRNDNSFKTYLVALTVLLSYLPTLQSEYQIITKVAKSINLSVNAKREDNVVTNEDKQKIIDLNKDTIMSNLKKLANIDDKLIYGLYTLQPSRREDDFRLMKLTYDSKPTTLDNEYNYLHISKDNDIQFIYNQYKTRKTYGQQTYTAPKELVDIILSYIDQYKIKEGDFIFYSNNNHKDKVSQSNFSKRISSTFKKVYGTPISIRYIRKSHSTYLYNIAYIEKWSEKQIKDYQNKMAHSKSESGLYRVIL